MDEFEDVRRELEQKAIRGEKWTPNDGDELVGRVIRKDNPIVGRDKENKEKRNELVVVNDSSGGLWTVWKSKALEEMFAKVKEGDVVGLKYVGKQKTQGGLPFKAIEWVLKPAAVQTVVA